MGWYVNSSRIHLSNRLRGFAKNVEKNQLVLDAGSGKAPYRSLFSHAIYETVDFEKVNKTYSPSTYVCNIDSIPVESERYDFVVLTQVLEHVPNPQKVVDELFRVLKPGGQIFCSCPLYYEEHEKPYDYFRYTQFSLRLIFTKSGFSVEKLDWLEGYFATMAYNFMLISKNLTINPFSYCSFGIGLVLFPINIIVKSSSVFLKGVFSRLDLLYKITEFGHPINYCIVARKPYVK